MNWIVIVMSDGLVKSIANARSPFHLHGSALDNNSPCFLAAEYELRFYIGFCQFQRRTKTHVHQLSLSR
jgi:hypothetical protein